MVGDASPLQHQAVLDPVLRANVVYLPPLLRQPGQQRQMRGDVPGGSPAGQHDGLDARHGTSPPVRPSLPAYPSLSFRFRLPAWISCPSATRVNTTPSITVHRAFTCGGTPTLTEE